MDTINDSFDLFTKKQYSTNNGNVNIMTDNMFDSFIKKHYSVNPVDEKIGNIKICSRCNSDRIIINHDQMICRKCLTCLGDAPQKVGGDQVVDINTVWNPEHYTKSSVHMSKVTTENRRRNQLSEWGRHTYRDKVQLETRKFITEVFKRNNITNTLIINETTKLFTILNKLLCRRTPIKFGILANAFRYVSKNYYRLYSYKELAKMFNIKKKIITKSNKIINALCKENIKIKNMINQKPIKLIDYSLTIKDKFPEFNKDDMRILDEIMVAIEGTLINKCNEPKSILAGLIVNLIELTPRLKLQISRSMIRSRLNVSSSTVIEYKEHTSPFF